MLVSLSVVKFKRLTSQKSPGLNSPGSVYMNLLCMQKNCICYRLKHAVLLIILNLDFPQSSMKIWWGTGDALRQNGKLFSYNPAWISKHGLDVKISWLISWKKNPRRPCQMSRVTKQMGWIFAFIAHRSISHMWRLSRKFRLQIAKQGDELKVSISFAMHWNIISRKKPTNNALRYFRMPAISWCCFREIATELSWLSTLWDS